MQMFISDLKKRKDSASPDYASGLTAARLADDVCASLLLYVYFCCHYILLAGTRPLSD